MKSISLLALLSFSTIAYGQSANQNIGTVTRVLGVPVFVMCEPINPYEVVAQVTDEDATDWANAANGQNTYRTIKESCTVIVTNAQRKQKKGKFDFDAIIISDDGNHGTCIKWKSNTEGSKE